MLNCLKSPSGSGAARHSVWNDEGSKQTTRKLDVSTAVVGPPPPASPQLIQNQRSSAGTLDDLEQTTSSRYRTPPFNISNPPSPPSTCVF